jgi:DNA polymerase iota
MCPVPQDCFYASVFENEDPSLKLLPLAVQQKQIIVTCNYEARRRVSLTCRLGSFIAPLCTRAVQPLQTLRSLVD